MQSTNPSCGAASNRRSALRLTSAGAVVFVLAFLAFGVHATTTDEALKSIEAVAQKVTDSASAAAAAATAATESKAKAAEAAASAASAAQAAAGKGKAQDLAQLSFDIQCVQVLKISFISWLNDKESGTQSTKCQGITSDTLTGIGEMVVFVKTDDYDKVKLALTAKSLPAESDGAKKELATSPEKVELPRLVLNGFDLGDGATAIASETIKGSKLTSFRFALRANHDSDDAWATLFREKGFLGKLDVRPALSWKRYTVFSWPDPAPLSNPKLQIAVTEWWMVAIGSAAALALLIIFAWALRDTDTFRASAAPPLWTEADTLRTQIALAGQGKIGFLKRLFTPSYRGHVGLRTAMNRYITKSSSAGPVALQPTATDAADGTATATPTGVALQAIIDYYDGAKAFVDADWQNCATLASDVFHGRYPQTDADTARAVIGLAMRQTWKVVRAPFSLSNVQIGVWTVFAVGSAVFLWIVHSSLFPLEGSTVALVTIAAVTSAASWVADPDCKQFMRSRGFLQDLMMGADGQAKAHRFQSVLVNALLLGVGVSWMATRLTYPVFDTTWLQFLGLSGATLALGKGLNEKSGGDGTDNGKQ